LTIAKKRKSQSNRRLNFLQGFFTGFEHFENSMNVVDATAPGSSASFLQSSP
jgi:hypothetical protein